MIKDDASVIKPTLESLKKTFQTGKTRSVSFRKQQLKNILKALKNEEQKIHEALQSDLGYKSINVTKVFAVGQLQKSTEYIIDHLDNWSQERSVDTNMIVGLAPSSKIRPEPYGVTLVIGSWNYPMSTTVEPAVEAIAAGNCVCIKPSELAPKSSNLIKEIFEKYLDKEAYQVVEGGVNVASNITKEPWDLIIFTGSPQKGKLVAVEAAKNLVPCILELGGKSPTIIDADANLDNAAIRIAWGKYSNCGQTCIAPDYVFLHEKVKDEFIKQLKQTVVNFFTENPQTCEDYARIVTEFHASRLEKMLQNHEGQVLFGGKCDVKDRYIQPTAILNPKKTCILLEEEIFGPILPILTYNDLNEVIQYVNERPKPLTLYYFGKNQNAISRLEKETSSGAVVVNDVISHMLNHQLPFGGIGQSGCGSLHGKFGFDNCSHLKPILYNDTFNGYPICIKYPPYTQTKMKVFNLVSKIGNVEIGSMKRGIGIGIFFIFAFYMFYRIYGNSFFGGKKSAYQSDL